MSIYQDVVYNSRWVLNFPAFIELEFEEHIMLDDNALYYTCLTFDGKYANRAFGSVFRRKAT